MFVNKRFIYLGCVYLKNKNKKKKQCYNAKPSA